MVLELKLSKIGDAVGIVLPKVALAHLKLEEGDTITLTEARDGMCLTPGNLEFSKAMTVFDSLNQRYSDTLRELAK